MIVVIPVHNQAKNLIAVLQGYLAQTKMPQAVVLSMDRCTDSSKEVAAKFVPGFAAVGSRLVVCDTSEFGSISGFGAGRTRDVGIIVAQQINRTVPVLCTDGDCVPSPDLVAHHGELLSAVATPRITCGRRYDTLGPDEGPAFQMVLPDAQDDVRNGALYMEHLVCAPGVDRVIFNPEVFEKSWVCWSCNLGFNPAALALCRLVNSVVVGDGSRVFNPVFDGRWGGEDGFVGLSVWRCGGDVLMLSERSWVKHIWHKRSHTNMDHLRLVQLQDYELQKALFESRIQGVQVTVVNVEFHIDRANMHADITTHVKNFAPSGAVDRIQQSLPDDPLTQIVSALFCSGYVISKPSQGLPLLPQPITKAGREDLQRDFEALLDRLRRVPFHNVGSVVEPAIPFDFSHGPVTFPEVAR